MWDVSKKSNDDPAAPSSISPKGADCSAPLGEGWTTRCGMILHACNAQIRNRLLFAKAKHTGREARVQDTRLC